MNAGSLRLNSAYYETRLGVLHTCLIIGKQADRMDERTRTCKDVIRNSSLQCQSQAPLSRNNEEPQWNFRIVGFYRSVGAAYTHHQAHLAASHPREDLGQVLSIWQCELDSMQVDDRRSCFILHRQKQFCTKTPLIHCHKMKLRLWTTGSFVNSLCSCYDSLL